MAHYVVAHVAVKPETRSEFIGLLQKHVKLSLQGDGCEAFDVRQDVNNDCNLVYVERYTSKAAFDRHITSERVVNYFKETSRFLAKSPDFAEYSDLSVK